MEVVGWCDENEVQFSLDGIINKIMLSNTEVDDSLATTTTVSPHDSDQLKTQQAINNSYQKKQCIFSIPTNYCQKVRENMQNNIYDTMRFAEFSDPHVTVGCDPERVREYLAYLQRLKTTDLNHTAETNATPTVIPDDENAGVNSQYDRVDVIERLQPVLVVLQLQYYKIVNTMQ